MVDQLPDLNFWGSEGGQFFPRSTFRKLDEEGGLFATLDGEEGYERVDNITEAALIAYRKAYNDPSITKDDIFFYTYALLHSPEYRDSFAADLKKSLPHIPRVQDFRGFASAGLKLSDLHLSYETATPYPGIVEDVRGATSATSATELYRVTKMKIPKVKGQSDRSTIIYSTRVTLSNIPAEAYRYQLGARSAIEWLIDRYQVKTDTASGIVNDPNDWSEDPRYIIDLLRRIVNRELGDDEDRGRSSCAGHRLVAAIQESADLPAAVPFASMNSPFRTRVGSVLALLADRPLTCGNCPVAHDHPDLRGHQPDPAHIHGPPAPQVAVQIESDDRLVRTAGRNMRAPRPG